MANEIKYSKRDWSYVEILSYICRPGASWMKLTPNNDPNHVPRKLAVKELKQEAKSWKSFLHHTIETCSNGSELQTIRALVVMTIMKKKGVNIGLLVVGAIFDMANKTQMRLIILCIECLSGQILC